MKSIGQLFSKVAHKALARHGGPVLPELLRVWPQLFAELESIARPLKVERRGRAPGSLKLQVQPGHALMVQMQERQIISRINAHFGHVVIERLRLVQAPFGTPQKQEPVQPDAALLAQLQGRVMQHHEGPLREALLRLAEGVARDAAINKGESA